jgi:hypothetical protein
MTGVVRRVVTGHDASGKSIVASDSMIEPLTVSALPGVAFHGLWGADQLPSFPDDGCEPRYSTHYPPIGGFRLEILTLPPKGPMRPSIDAGAARELEEKLPGLAEFTEPGGRGLHTTPTMDFDIVLSGKVTLELDGRVEVKLGPGDIVIQNGTRHRWMNHGTTDCRLAVVLLGVGHESTAKALPREHTDSPTT